MKQFSNNNRKGVFKKHINMHNLNSFKFQECMQCKQCHYEAIDKHIIQQTKFGIPILGSYIEVKKSTV
mgnify:CR=1 FL=1